ncbi:MAG: excinuclease ABC subunit UvrC [Deltaproteobacteria bacterium]|nr:excinuclease ABC subunit UvrC [Deltaproteobacteria bacterium]
MAKARSKSGTQSASRRASKKAAAGDGASVASTRRPSKSPSVPAGWEPRITNQEQLDECLGRLPDEPGVYMMRDRKGEVVYVGKARRLRARVRQYFNGHDTRAFVPLLSQIVGDLETVVTENNKEALLLENNLIKEHRPRFNVKLRDDSNYLVIRLDPTQKWPRLELVRQIRQDGAQYFGPYHSASSARATLRVVNRHFQLRTCTDYVLERRRRACLQYQIERCPGPCVYDVDPESYGAQVHDVGLFLSGRHRELTNGLRARMKTAADELQFEVAARVRDQLSAIETTLTAQQVVGAATLDQDAIGMYREGGQVEFAVMHIRQGKLLGRESHSAKGLEHPDSEVLADFVSGYYAKAVFLPDEVLLPSPIAEDDAVPLAAWLREEKGRKVVVTTPERGDRRKLTRLAERNAASNFVTRRNRREDSDAALGRLRTRLKLSKLPRVIECYDVSHIQGSDTVASMVVFVDGVADKSRYRSFRIKGTGARDDEATLRQGAFQNDDFTSMYEVLGRRFRRALQVDEDDSWALPDLVVIDGGKGQLSRVVTAMSDLGIAVGVEGVDVVALAKERKRILGHGRAAMRELKARREAGEQRRYEDIVLAEDTATEQGQVEVRPERVFVPGVKEPIRLKPGSSERYLMERIRDEAHRFAINHHRKRRGKRSLKSSLDDISGVGPALKRSLVKHFGSIASIRGATIEQLGEVKGVGPALAKRIRESLGGG